VAVLVPRNRCAVAVTGLSQCKLAKAGPFLHANYSALQPDLEKAKFYGTIVGDKEVWLAADCRAAWLHRAVFRLSSESPDAKSHGSRGVHAPADR
jgi:hypothetical protein